MYIRHLEPTSLAELVPEEPLSSSLHPLKIVVFWMLEVVTPLDQTFAKLVHAISAREAVPGEAVGLR